MKKLILVLIISISYNINAKNDPSEEGKKLYKKVNCKQCHGKKGMGKAKLDKSGKWKLSGAKGPRIAGLQEEYLITQLKAIQGKDKETMRKSRNTISMKAKIKKLSEKDFQNLAHYIALELNKKEGVFKGMLQSDKDFKDYQESLKKK